MLLSDGGENVGHALDATRLAEARGVQLDVVNTSRPGGDEALVAQLEAPTRVREGQEFTLSATVESTSAQSAKLRIFGDATQLVEQTVDLKAGTNTFTFPIKADGQGFQRYRAQIEPQNDVRLQNNEAATLVQIQGPSKPWLLCLGTCATWAKD